MEYYLTLPLKGEQIKRLCAGDVVYLSGEILTARDAAHKRLCDALVSGDSLPVDLKNAAIYYCGPTPSRQGEVIGSCGPTTSGRMDDYTPFLMDKGLRITIGKGQRSCAVTESIKKHGGIYFSAIGGAAALMKSCVTDCTLIAYGDLGCEAIYRLSVRNMPLITWIDSKGNSL